MFLSGNTSQQYTYYSPGFLRLGNLMLIPVQLFFKQTRHWIAVKVCFCSAAFCTEYLQSQQITALSKKILWSKENKILSPLDLGLIKPTLALCIKYIHRYIIITGLLCTFEKNMAAKYCVVTDICPQDW